MKDIKTLEKAARMALEALESIDGVGDVVRWHKQFEYFGKATTALRQALEQPASKPWVDLTEEQIVQLSLEWPAETNDWASHIDFARAIEAELKDKNNG